MHGLAPRRSRGAALHHSEYCAVARTALGSRPALAAQRDVDLTYFAFALMQVKNVNAAPYAFAFAALKSEGPSYLHRVHSPV